MACRPPHAPCLACHLALHQLTRIRAFRPAPPRPPCIRAEASTAMLGTMPSTKSTPLVMTTASPGRLPPACNADRHPARAAHRYCLSIARDSRNGIRSKTGLGLSNRARAGSEHRFVTEATRQPAQWMNHAAPAFPARPLTQAGVEDVVSIALPTGVTEALSEAARQAQGNLLLIFEAVHVPIKRNHWRTRMRRDRRRG